MTTTLLQRLGATRLGVQVIGRLVSPTQRRLLRLTGGGVSLTGRLPVLLLTTRGRRTGLDRTVPLIYLTDGSRRVVCNVQPPHERPNPWVLNLTAEPRARVEVGRADWPVSARPARPDEVERWWPALVELWPAYRVFHDQGGTRHLFVLERAESESGDPT